ncbi:MAG TPA: alpha/beta fold hydrolase [Gammaproteobacteria bacterium]|nr:alpha/beta fold hydrolase [Gammaproteobacteria bacterium]
MEEAPCGGEELFLQGPAGNIEVSISYPAGPRGEGAVAILCHPHPLFGGSMANKVIHTLSETFNGMGGTVLRFNFRGVGSSEGKFDHGRGEADDLAAIASWLRRRNPAVPLWVAGFSFGAYVALRAQPVVQAERLLLVAPPVPLFDFRHLAPVTVPWMVIQGGRDETVDPEAVLEWLQRQQPRPLLRLMADADHFFHGRLRRLRGAVETGWHRLPSENTLAKQQQSK